MWSVRHLTIFGDVIWLESSPVFTGALISLVLLCLKLVSHWRGLNLVFICMWWLRRWKVEAVIQHDSKQSVLEGFADWATHVVVLCRCLTSSRGVNRWVLASNSSLCRKTPSESKQMLHSISMRHVFHNRRTNNWRWMAGTRCVCSRKHRHLKYVVQLVEASTDLV